MQGKPAFLAILLGTIFCVLGASLSRALRYKAPDECEWLAGGDETPSGHQESLDTTDSEEQEVSLVCRLRTINSELENTNFSVIQPRHTVRLRLECSDALFYQSSLSAGSFRPLSELKELVIEYCKIGNLSDDAFRGLSQLRNLTVRTHNTDWSSMALEVSSRAFTEDLGLLERLDLGYNNMWVLPEGSLCPLSNLEALNLTHNRLREVASFRFGLGTGSRCASNLRVLDLSHNSVDSLPPAAFSGLARLRSLDLRCNGLGFVADRALEGTFALARIDLSSNRLASLPPELFADSRDLREIHLRNNSLSVLPPGLFGELSQLLVLDMSRNELTAEWINSATFAGLVRLVVLDLAANRIARLEPSVFRDLYSLQILRLQENLIESLPENAFSALSNLHTLVLSDNRLSRIDAATFSGLYVLSLLSLDNNRLAELHPASLRNASSLQELHLNGNRLQAVPEALRSTSLLRTLDLGENHISGLAGASFEHMSHLSGLRLMNNRIGNLSRGVFDKLRNLNILTLAGNRIEHIEPGSFDDNAKLQAVRLDGNRLTDMSGLFARLPNLVWLNASDNRLRSFDYAMIPTCLQWLDVHANEIGELGDYHEIESQLQLKTLDASLNKLTEITGSSIPAGVEMLYLNDNLIARLQSYAFFKKPNLTRVDLKGNRLRRLEPYALRIAAVPADRTLPEFYIGDNDFLCDCTMEWLQRVNQQESGSRVQPRVMDLDSIHCELLYDRERLYVPLLEATHSQFLCEYDSHCFALCHCCDFDACDCEMTCPANCTCYHDQTWTANVVDCSAGGHTGRLPEQIPMDATRLYLDGNDLRLISSHAFIGRKKLKVLFLNASNIEALQNRSFNGLKNLEDLHLQDNGLRELKGYEFIGLETLRVLRLERNRLSVIANETFAALRSLAVLHLQGNRLRSLALWTLPPSAEVGLAGNPWTCDCEFVREFRELATSDQRRVSDAMEARCSIQTNEVKREEYGGNDEDEGRGGSVNDDETAVAAAITEDYSLMTGRGSSVNGSICSELESAESGLAGGNLTSRRTTLIERQALGGDYLPLFLGTLAGFLALLGACTLGFFFRHEMRVWLHSRFGVRLFYRRADSERDERDGKLFDAFVSYSSKDEAFVAEELAPVLELGNPSYKLCLHYRDFPVGSFIADTIVQAVESSRRTIMVLSENFIKSEWCRFDFKSAHHQVLRDRRRRLILVLVGDVPQRDLDPDIRLYLKTNTYLQWGDKLFWEKLRFALPDVPNNQRGGPQGGSHNHHDPLARRQPPPPVRRQHNQTAATPGERSRTLSVHI